MPDWVDNRTLLFVAGGLYVLVPPCTWLVLPRPRSLGQVLWCTGGILGGFGLILISVRGLVPDAVSYLIGQPLLALGPVIVAQSLRLELNRLLPWRWVVVGALAYAGALASLLAFDGFASLGVVIRAVNLIAICILIEAAYVIARAERSRGVTAIAAVYVVQAVGIAGNLVNALVGSEDIQNLTGSSVTSAVSLVTLLVCIAASMGYLGLALERSARRQLRLADQLTQERQLKERRETLIALDRQRIISVLADSLGHEITQPLTAAQIRVQTALMHLERAGLDPDRQQRYIDGLIADVRRAADTVSRVRDMIRPRPERDDRVELRTILTTVSQMLRQESISRRIRLVIEPTAVNVSVQGDRLQLVHALMHLIRNSMTAISGQREKEIRIWVNADTDKVMLHVADNGPGLPKSALQRTDTEWIQQPQTNQGIGLFVVRSIVQRHGGRLVLGNREQGGAVATMALPIRRPTEPELDVIHHVQ